MIVKKRVSILAIICLITSMIVILGLLPGCEGNTKGETALKNCVVSQSQQNSMKKSREKKEKEDKVQANAPELKSFTAQTLDGGTFTEKDLAGYDLTMINFWQTTCGTCIDEMPALAGLADAAADRVQIVTWCFDAPGQEESARAILTDAGFTKPCFATADGDLYDFANSVIYTPTTVLVDSEGRLVGEPQIGAFKDPKQGYTDYINQGLKALGKDPI